MQKKTGLGDKKITVTPAFHSKISIENPLTACLIEFIETYDNLVATIKLLHLAGSFDSEQDYYANITRIQKKNKSGVKPNYNLIRTVSFSE